MQLVLVLAILAATSALVVQPAGSSRVRGQYRRAPQPAMARVPKLTGQAAWTSAVSAVVSPPSGALRLPSIRWGAKELLPAALSPTWAGVGLAAAILSVQAWRRNQKMAAEAEAAEAAARAAAEAQAAAAAKAEQEAREAARLEAEAVARAEREEKAASDKAASDREKVKAAASAQAKVSALSSGMDALVELGSAIGTATVEKRAPLALAPPPPPRAPPAPPPPETDLEYRKRISGDMTVPVSRLDELKLYASRSQFTYDLGEFDLWRRALFL